VGLSSGACRFTDLEAHRDSDGHEQPIPERIAGGCSRLLESFARVFRLKKLSSLKVILKNVRDPWGAAYRVRVTGRWFLKCGSDGPDKAETNG